MEQSFQSVQLVQGKCDISTAVHKHFSDESAEGMQKEYEHSVVEDVECIVMKWVTGRTGSKTEAKEEIKRRKGIKKELGYSNKNTPILDVKYQNAIRVFCDVIIYSENSSHWLEACKVFYKGRETYEKTLSGGTQLLVLTADGELQLSISCYFRTKLVMIQPGNRNEKHLLQFLRDFPYISACKQHSNVIDKQSLQKDSNYKVCEGAADEMTKKALPPASTARAKCATEAAYCSLLPEAKQQMVDVAVQASPPAPSTPKLAINEVLCFLQNWLNDHTHESILKLCCDFYTQTEISQAKEVLFNNVTTKRRKIKRKGTEKSKLDVQDMMVILLELELPHPVIFVSQNLSRIPPRDRDAFDIMHTTKEIDELKSIVQQLCDNQAAITRLVKQHPVTSPDAGSHRSTRDIGTLTSFSSKEGSLDCNSSNTSQVIDGHHEAESTEQSPTEAIRSQEPPVIACDPVPADHDSVNPSSLSQYTVIDEITDDTVTHAESPMHSTCLSLESTCDEHRWADVLGRHRGARRRTEHHNAPKHASLSRHSKYVRPQPQSVSKFGNAPKSSIEAVLDSRGNRQCTGLFVSRLKPGTSCAQLAIFIHREYGYLMRPEKMPSRCAEYCSFFLRCNREKRQVLLNSDVWPKGAVIKPFYTY